MILVGSIHGVETPSIRPTVDSRHGCYCALLNLPQSLNHVILPTEVSTHTVYVAQFTDERVKDN